jgi:hypothetical protein
MVTEHQDCPHVMEVTETIPPPMFSSTRVCTVVCGFVEDVVNESRSVRAVNCGGTALTRSDTGMDCEFPAHGLGATHATTIVVW